MKIGVVLLALLVAVSIGCAFGGKKAPVGSPVETTGVRIKNAQFSPPVIEVTADATVTWTFDDGPVPHDVRGAGFQSEILRGGTFAWKFDTAGTYDYHCSLHDDMVGKVIVKGAQ
jgi:plastocyanin